VLRGVLCGLARASTADESKQELRIARIAHTLMETLDKEFEKILVGFRHHIRR